MNATILPGARGLLGGGLAPPGESSVTSLNLTSLLAAIVVYGVLYGAAMGMFTGFHGDRAWQVPFSATKVPLLLLATFLISLPSFFVLNTLMGLRGDFAEALRALMTTQAGLTIILASLSPITLVWYRSNTDYLSAVMFNAMMFAVASLAAQALLRRLYRPLIARDPKHRLLLRGWIVIYAFVGIQMGWTLRPFIGDPDRSPTFFRPDAWQGNAYIRVVEIVGSVVRDWLR